MSNFLREAEKIIKSKGLNIYRIAEICDGNLNFTELTYANPCQDAYSVAKVFTVTAAMMLADRGMLKLSEKVTDIFAHELPCDLDPRWYDVTVDHLLSHMAGFHPGQLDIDCQDATEYETNDFLKLLFTTPLLNDPGTKWVYSDATFYMAARVVTQKLGQMIDDFLLRELFVPCKVREVAWSKCPMGHPMGATGLYIRAEDIAKLGEIYRTGGKYGDHRILSETAVRTVLEREYELTKHKDGKYYSKGGMRGQMLMIVPDKKRVVAWTGCDDGDMSDLMKLAVECE